MQSTRPRTTSARHPLLGWPALLPAGLALASAALPVHALGPQAPPDGSFQVRAREILMGDGSRIRDGVLLVGDGRILRVGRGVEVDERLPLVEHEGVLSAGIVACQGASATRAQRSDSTRTTLPEARVADVLDLDHSDLRRVLEAGITTLVVTPGPENLVGGRTAVVKTAGGRVLDDAAHLALSFSKRALAAQPVPETELENTELSRRGLRAPTSYSGAVRELERLFASRAGPYAAAARGELPVLIEAWDRNEVARAAEFARAHGLVGAVRGAPLARDVVEPLRASGLAVVLGPFSEGAPRAELEAVSVLLAAGVPVAFALDTPDHDPERLRLSAAMSLAAGADPAAVWRALSADAARIAGVEGRVGRLERGLDADLVLWDGDPLNLTSRVVAVYVDGALAFRGGSR